MRKGLGAAAVLGLATLALGGGPAWAAGVPYTKGDVFAGVGAGKIKHFSPTGTLLDTLDSTTGSSETTGMAFETSGNLLATMFTVSTVSRFNNMGGLIAANFGSGYNAHPESVAIDTSGNVYVGQADGNQQILKFSSTGTPLASYTIVGDARGSDWIDLAADQCTMYYTSEGTKVKRFNVCTNTQLADFATGLSGPMYALRILGDGGVLVAATNKVLRLDNTGAVISTYPAPAGDTLLFALNLDPDGTTFWTGDIFNGVVHRFAISPVAAPVTTFSSGILGSSMAGLAVFGEITQSQPTPTPGTGPTNTPTATPTLVPAAVNGVPTLDHRGLTLLTVLVAAVGFLLSRRFLR